MPREIVTEANGFQLNGTDVDKWELLGRQYTKESLSDDISANGTEEAALVIKNKQHGTEVTTDSKVCEDSLCQSHLKSTSLGT